MFVLVEPVAQMFPQDWPPTLAVLPAPAGLTPRPLLKRSHRGHGRPVGAGESGRKHPVCCQHRQDPAPRGSSALPDPGAAAPQPGCAGAVATLGGRCAPNQDTGPASAPPPPPGEASPRNAELSTKRRSQRPVGRSLGRRGHRHERCQAPGHWGRGARGATRVRPGDGGLPAPRWGPRPRGPIRAGSASPEGSPSWGKEGAGPGQQGHPLGSPGRPRPRGRRSGVEPVGSHLPWSRAAAQRGGRRRSQV